MNIITLLLFLQNNKSVCLLCHAGLSELLHGVIFGPCLDKFAFSALSTIKWNYNPAFSYITSCLYYTAVVWNNAFAYTYVIFFSYCCCIVCIMYFYRSAVNYERTRTLVNHNYEIFEEVLTPISPCRYIHLNVKGKHSYSATSSILLPQTEHAGV